MVLKISKYKNCLDFLMMCGVKLFCKMINLYNRLLLEKFWLEMFGKRFCLWILKAFIFARGIKDLGN